MTEQTTIPTPNETASTSLADAKPTKKSRPTKQTITKTAAKKDTKKSQSLTADQKRLARNAALREWRRKNEAHMKIYRAEWKLKRKGKQSEPAKRKQERTKSVTVRATSRKSQKPKTGRKT